MSEVLRAGQFLRLGLCPFGIGATDRGCLFSSGHAGNAFDCIPFYTMGQQCERSKCRRGIFKAFWYNYYSGRCWQHGYKWHIRSLY